MAASRTGAPAESAAAKSGIEQEALERFWRGLSARQREELNALTGGTAATARRRRPRSAHSEGSGAACGKAGQKAGDTAVTAGAAGASVAAKARGGTVPAAEGPRGGRETLRAAFEGAVAQISQEKLLKLIDSLVERGSAPGLRLFAQIAGIDLSAEPAPDTTAGTQVIIVGPHPAESAPAAVANGTEKTGDAH